LLLWHINQNLDYNVWFLSSTFAAILFIFTLKFIREHDEASFNSPIVSHSIALGMFNFLLTAIHYAYGFGHLVYEIVADKMVASWFQYCLGISATIYVFYAVPAFKNSFWLRYYLTIWFFNGIIRMDREDHYSLSGIRISYFHICGISRPFWKLFLSSVQL